MSAHHARIARFGSRPNRNGAGTQGRRRPKWRAYLAIFVVGAGAAWGAASELGFSRSITKGLVEHYAARFGSASRTRLTGWQEFVRAHPAERRQTQGSEVELLSSVNNYVNRIPFLSDMQHWGVEDYWATPAEALASNGADCEDFSIAKYFTLKELGVPIERLRITYVKAVRLNQAHMVLAYYPVPNAVPLILDNLEEKVRPANERTDLIPVYSFNDEDVLLTRPGQRAANAGSSLQIRLWRALLDKLEKELLL
ncbi:MAG: transglutaminase-like cysteine peptidase [Proteobacteria bacterium]|nr:transglutaminase-like cysteine peptidase [Pseudomonadota bacterium]